MPLASAYAYMGAKNCIQALPFIPIPVYRYAS